MSAVSSQVRDAGAILPAVDAITNTKALAVEFVAMAVGVALFGLFVSMGMSSMSFSAFALAFLLFLMCAGTGFNAAGVVLMAMGAVHLQVSTGPAIEIGGGVVRIGQLFRQRLGEWAVFALAVMPQVQHAELVEVIDLVDRVAIDLDLAVELTG